MEPLLHQKPRRPTLAILTHSDDTRLFRGNKENYIDLIAVGEAKGVHVYVMTTANFKLTNNQAVGYSYNFKTKSWKKELLPLPHVIYNRIPYRKFEQLPEVQPILQSCLRHRSIHFFNPSFFNKWTLFEWLNKSKETGPYIPTTQKLTNSEDLDKLLLKHSSLYLKPIRGKAGKGIMKVSRIIEKTSKTQKYQLSVQDKTRSHISRYTNVSQLWTQINEMMVTQDYIMQQAISLSLYKQRPFDLRVLVQKNSKGAWSVAGIGARLAGKLSITTHVPRGGSIDDPAKLLSAGFGAAESKKILQRARSASLLIAKQIGKASGSNLGEMSLDLGVDTTGQIWFFEANSKPMKFDEPHIRKLSLDNLINYCIHLSKKAKKKIVNTMSKKAR
ncbi:YheC/D like ATP-grasp [Paenibacillus sp. 1_12]|uniref:YheC/YheD family endospore coat-associated protein n=1 Tax=Paenibacillus sp. 1_12 TaxID=1566278 RepID=UPI0008F20045|nr:YheC/YheD family protein [Paenibacillus sp. 1_12]SFM20134.1 YheC/D like ATP-grasp [Paenibacillus sp. 1_12]